MKNKVILTTFFVLFFCNTFYSQLFKKDFIRTDYNCLTNSISSIEFYNDSMIRSSISIYSTNIQYSTYYYYNKDKRLIKVIEYENDIITREKIVENDSTGEPINVKIIDHTDCYNSKKCILKKDKKGNIIEIKEYSDREKKHLISWYKFFYSYDINYLVLTKALQ